MRLRKPSIDATMFFILPILGYVMIHFAGARIFSPIVGMVYLALLLSPAFWIIHRYLNPEMDRVSIWLNKKGQPVYTSVIFVLSLFHRTGVEFADTLEPGLGSFLRTSFTVIYFLLLLSPIIYVIWDIWRNRGGGGGGGDNDDDPEPEPVEPPKEKASR